MAATDKKLTTAVDSVGYAPRRTLLARGGPDAAGFIRHTYRPFDMRWLYWVADTKLLNEKRPDYRPHVFEGNMWLSAAPHLRKRRWSLKRA